MGKEKKEKKPGFFAEFKAFITKGNVLDMAVGVIIGGAFNAIITALKNKILMPIINAVLSYITDGQGLYTILWASKKVVGASGTEEEIAAAIEAGGQLGPNGAVYSRLFYIDWSAFIEAVINFLLIALTLFIIIKVFRTLQKKRLALEEAIKNRNKQAEDEASTEAAAAPAPALEAAPANDEVVLLLKEIRDSLKSQSAAEAVKKDLEDK